MIKNFLAIVTAAVLLLTTSFASAAVLPSRWNGEFTNILTEGALDGSVGFVPIVYNAANGGGINSDVIDGDVVAAICPAAEPGDGMATGAEAEAKLIAAGITYYKVAIADMAEDPDWLGQPKEWQDIMAQSPGDVYVLFTLPPAPSLPTDVFTYDGNDCSTLHYRWSGEFAFALVTEGDQGVRPMWNLGA